MNRASASLLLIGLGGAVVLAACGGGAESSAPAKAPGRASDAPREPEREPSSVAEAQEQITRAREELGELKKSEAAGDKDSAAAPGTAGGTSSTTAKPTGPPAAREEKASAGLADPCAQSCRALSSMRRAVSALCRMTGDEDARCSDARKTLQQSESRVAQCHCGP